MGQTAGRGKRRSSEPGWLRHVRLPGQPGDPWPELAATVLPRYLVGQRWYAAKDAGLPEVEVTQLIGFPPPLANAAMLAVLRVTPPAGIPALPAAFASRPGAEAERPVAVLEHEGSKVALEADGVRERRGFGWLNGWRILEHPVRKTTKGFQRMIGVEVELNDWMFRSIVKDRRVLTISSAYFGLTMGLERRLYELARKHCGDQERWRIGLPRLAEKCGSRRALKKFRFELTRIIGKDTLPDYRLAILSPPSGEKAAPGRSVVERVQIEFAPR